MAPSKSKYNSNYNSNYKTVNDTVKDEFEKMKKDILDLKKKMKELSVTHGNTKSKLLTKAKSTATKAKLATKAKAKATAKKNPDAPKRGRTPPQPSPATAAAEVLSNHDLLCIITSYIQWAHENGCPWNEDDRWVKMTILRWLNEE